MRSCLKCRGRLSNRKVEAITVLHCDQCRGQAVSLASLVQYGKSQEVLRLRELAGQSPSGTRACFECSRAMAAVMTSDACELDVCLACQWVWFDAEELARFPKNPRPIRPGVSQSGISDLGRFTLSPEEEVRLLVDVLGLLPDKSK